MLSRRQRVLGSITYCSLPADHQIPITTGAAPAVSAADQARIAAALEASCAANTTRAYRSGGGQLGSDGPPSTATRSCQPRRLPSPPTSRTAPSRAPASQPSAWRAQRSA